MESDQIAEIYDATDFQPLATIDDPQNAEIVDDAPIQIIDGGGKKTLVGYAVVWGATSGFRTSDGYRHQYMRGSILWAENTYALWAHIWANPLAGLKNKTLRLSEDDYGAKVEIDLDDTSDGQNALIRVQSGLISGMSFKAIRKKTDFKRTDDPSVIQPFNCLGVEVSLTGIPAMRETQIFTKQNSHKLLKDNSAALAKRKITQARLALLRPA